MTPLIKQRILHEIDLIPDEKLADLYNFLRKFRKGLESAYPSKSEEIMAFAGCWQDMPEKEFTEFIAEITERRSQAFEGRRIDESLAR